MPKGGLRKGAGMPRSNKPRCACGDNTLKRATARGFGCCRRNCKTCGGGGVVHQLVAYSEVIDIPCPDCALSVKDFYAKRA